MKDSKPVPGKVILKQNILLLLPLVVLLIVLELIWSERVWMLFLVALGSVWGFEFLWAHALSRGLRFKRELRYGWVQVGDQMQERFTLCNASRLPALWVQVTDHSNLAGYDARIATGVPGEGETVWSNQHVCARRGAFHIGPTTVLTGTPFGLYSIEFQYAALDSVIVMPPVVPLPELTVAPGGRAYEGQRRASTFERTVSAVGVREYVHGDTFNAIHWRTSAHTDELMVRTFDNTPAGDWLIWLDLAQTAQVGAGENSTLEHSIILAASLAERGLQTGRAVGLIVNARELVWLAPQAGEFQRLHILRALATVEASSQPLTAQITALAQAIDRHVSILFVTAALEAEWMSPVLSLQSHTNVPTVILLDPAGYGGTKNAGELTETLARWGIPHFLITRDWMDQPAAHPGHGGDWEWRVGATGRAIARTTPAEEAWRTLT